MTKVLIVAHEAVGATMTGPSIRCWELANALSSEFEVTLAVPEVCGSPAAACFPIKGYRREDAESLTTMAEQSDAILVSGYLLSEFPAVGRLGHPLIVDVYDPFPIENLNLLRTQSIGDKTSFIEDSFRTVSHLLRVGDFFICGSERQRDFWLGMLAANGRLNPRTYGADPTYRELIDVVPMGIPAKRLVAAGSVKGVVRGIDPGDCLVVWPGGVWDWFDPLTAVRAIGKLVGDYPDIKLLFPGLRHPHPERVGFMENPAAILREAERLGILNRQVFCHDWTPYAERANYLVDADIAISLHFDNLETHFAIRTRLLDCLWAGIPVISTKGDVVTEALAERGLARLVPPKDIDAVAEAILGWRSEDRKGKQLATRFQAMAHDYQWPVVCRPLASYLRQLHKAADRTIEATGAAPAASRPEALARLAAVDRWETEELLSLPFDQYQRQRQAAQIIEALRETDRTLRILDAGGGFASVRRFLPPTDLVVSVDPRPMSDPPAVKGHGAYLPFADASFDFAMALDTLEHVAQDRRMLMVDECARVAKTGVVLIGPFASPEAAAAENLLFEFIRCTLGAEHEQLREHLVNGLPDRVLLEAHLQELGYAYLVRPSGYIHRWLTMMLLKHYLLSLPASGHVHQQLERYYNRYYYWADQCTPSYRSVIFLAKNRSEETLRRAGLALDGDGASGRRSDEGGELRALGQLGLLVNLASMRATNARFGLVDAQIWGSSAGGQMADMASLKQALAESAAKLRQRDKELAEARDLLDRIAQGKVMRLMNGVQKLFSSKGK